MKILALIGLLFLCSQVTSQEQLINKLKKSQENLIFKEKVFIHTNKTSYRSSDVIWFKAYVGDFMNRPSTKTTKLYVNLLNDLGLTIYKKKILIQEGIGSGQFELGEKMVSGTYYIQAFTNHMRNFGDYYHHLSEIEIEGEISKQITVEKNKYNIKLLPESDYLLEGVKNTIAIKALLNDHKANFSGNIQNSKGEKVLSFNSSYSGIAKFNLFYQNGETYTANIVLSDTVLMINVPVARKKGIVFSVDVNDQNYVNISLRTNKATFKNQEYSNYSLLCHQDHIIFDLISLTRFDSLIGNIQLKKSRFLNGVNSITLFDDLKPIAERKFFIEKAQEQPIIEMEEIGAKNDSTRFKLKIQNQKAPITGKLSVSILRNNSDVFSESQNIRSAFLLTSFLKEYTLNPIYFFNSENKKSKEYLDLLLLMHESLPSEIIEKLSPVSKHEFEYGFELKGKVVSSEKYDSIALIRNDYQIIDKVNLNEDSRFRFNNLIVFKEDTMRVAFIDTFGKLIKPRRISFDSINNFNKPAPKIPFNGRAVSTYKVSDTQKNPILNSKYDSIMDNIPNEIIALDEAIITEKKRNKRYFERKKLIEKYKPVVFDISRYYNIPIPELFIKYNYGLLEYLKAKGIRKVNTNPFDIYYVDPASRKVIVQIDGRLISPEELSGINLRMTQIENILVSNEGRIGGKLFRGQIYQVFTKKKYGSNTISFFNENIIKNGYDRNKKYYTPQYPYNNKRSKKLIEVDWKPYLQTNSEGEVYFQIMKNNESGPLLFSIQGFSGDGYLISQTIIKY